MPPKKSGQKQRSEKAPQKKENAEKKENSNERSAPNEELNKRIEQLVIENVALKNNFNMERVLAELKKENIDRVDYIIGTTINTLVQLLDDYKKNNTKDVEMKGKVEGLRLKEETQANVDVVSWKQKIEDLETQVSDLKRNNESLEIERKKHEKEINDLSEENNKLKNGIGKPSENGTKRYEKEMEELKQENKKLKDEINESVATERKKHEKEITDLREENNKLKKGISANSENGTKRYEKEMEELKQENKKLKDEKNESVEIERKKHEKEIKDLREENNKLKKGISEASESGTKRYEKEMEELKQENKKLKDEKNESVEIERKKHEKEIKDLREENNKLKKGISEASESGTKRYEKEMEELKQENKKLKDEKNESVEIERKKHEKEIKDLREENNKLKKGISEPSKNGTKRYEKEMEELKQENKKLKDEKNESVEIERKKHEKEIKDLREENNKLKKGTGQATENGTKRYEKEMEELKKENKKLQDELLTKKMTSSDSSMEINKLQKEVDRLQTRLSEMAGAQMTHNNPNIADLSDAYRPTKLSEEYTQLYDNEWTDAYEEMDREGGTEQIIIKSLLARLMDCFEFCKTTSREFSNKLEESSLALPGLKSQQKSRENIRDIPVVYKKQLQDMKKSFGVLLRDEVKDLYWSKKNSKQEKEKTKNYVNKCIELCWLMAIQEPPVVIDKEAESSSSFDTDKYRTYTQTGIKIDFVVWPPLRLHEGGAFLAKGVAQGKK